MRIQALTAKAMGEYDWDEISTDKADMLIRLATGHHEISGDELRANLEAGEIAYYGTDWNNQIRMYRDPRTVQFVEKEIPAYDDYEPADV